MKWYTPTLFKAVVCSNIYTFLLDISMATKREFLNQPQRLVDVILPCTLGLALVVMVITQEGLIRSLRNNLQWARTMIDDYQQIMQKTIDWMNKAIKEQSEQGEEWKNQ